MTLTSLYLLYFFGAEFMGVFWITALLYKKFTEKSIIKRAQHIKTHKRLDRLADAYLSETLANFYTVKHFNADVYQSH